MTIRPLSWSLAAATLCLSVAGGAHAQITATTASTPITCNGGSNGSATVTPSGGSGGYSYTWSPTGGSGASATGLPAGTYSVTISDGSGNTPIVKDVTVSQPDVLVVTTSKTDATSAAATDGSVTASVTGGNGGYGYTWSPTGGSAATASGLGVGGYTVFVEDAKGCSITSALTNVVVGAPPASVPTLTEWAMILLTGLLALFGAARLGFLPAARKD